MSESRIEILILNNLIHNEPYSRKVLPYLQDEYFRESHEKLIFRHSADFIAQYNKFPTISELAVSVQKDPHVPDETYKEVLQTLERIEQPDNGTLDWLVDQTEEFCKEKALYNAARQAILIMEGKDKKLDKGAIPQIYEDALAISFDPSIGHDYAEDAEARFDKLHATEYKLPFDIDICNKVTKGGVAEGTLNLIAGGVYVGKTLALCHLAKCYMIQGKNPLYITLEISEENIGLRIDCNHLNISIDEIDNVPKDVFMSRVQKMRASLKGKLVIKEYPATSVHVNNFRALLHELKLKKDFIPDVILVDYLNLMSSARFKASEKTHIIIQAIAEELRSLAQETGIPIWSATQLDAEGMESSDPGMTNIAGSKVGLAATVDLMWMIVSSEQLRKLGQLLVIQHKNRYKDASDQKKFYVGLDRKKFRWFNVEQKGQTQEEHEEDPLERQEEIKQNVSKKYGQQAYQSAYGNTKQARQFGPRGKKPGSFSDFKV